MSKAIGEQNPTQGEDAVSWQTWSDGAAGIPEVTGNLDWGKLKLDMSGEEGRSAVYDLGSEKTRKFTLTENRYGSGAESAVLQYRTDTASFLQDDVLPAWTSYTVPFSVNCRYIQVREITGSYHDMVLGYSPLAYWPLSETNGMDASDISGNGFDGTYVGTPTLGESGITGHTSIKFIADSYCNVYSAGLAGAFTPEELTIGCFFKAPDAGWWADDIAHYIFCLQADAGNLRALLKNTSNSVRGYDISGSHACAVSEAFHPYSNWFHVLITTSKSNDRLRLFINGSKSADDVTGIGNYSGALNSSTTVVSNYNTSHLYSSLGWQSDFFIINRELSPTEISVISNPFSGSVISYFAIGDSKTANGPNWRSYLNDLLPTVNRRIVGLPYMYAAGGWTTQNVKDGIDAALATRTEIPQYIISDLGANDVNSDPGITWKNNTDYIVDACHAKYPSAIIYLTKVWKRYRAANIAIINAYIDQLVADANHAGWLLVGVNEADFLEGGDDGATYTSDGVHPNVAGCILWANAMKTVLGY